MTDPRDNTDDTPASGNCHDDLVEALANMTALVRLRYGNLDEDVNKLLSKADDALSRARAVGPAGAPKDLDRVEEPEEVRAIPGMPT